MQLPPMQPVPLADLPSGMKARVIGAAGAGFPSPSQDWAEDSISLIELLKLDRAASFVFRIVCVRHRRPATRPASMTASGLCPEPI